MRKIALFGGAFDPPHSAHAKVVKLVLDSKLADEVWLVPTADSRYDKKSVINNQSRLDMLNLLVDSELKGLPVRVEPIQLKGALPDCGTMELIDVLRVIHGGCYFSFVIGGDLVAQLPTWRNADRLKREVIFLVVQRPGAKPIKTDFQVKYVKGETEEISSTEIRKELAKNGDLSKKLPKSVWDYIIKKDLYRVR